MRLRALGGIASWLLASVLLSACATAAPPADAQRAHHTASGFRNNYVERVDRSFAELLRWQWEALRDGLPPAPRTATPVTTPDLPLVHGYHAAHAKGQGTPAITWIGHASALVQAGGLNVLTDPIFSERASPVQIAGPKRAQPPGLALEQLPAIDVVLISHNHYDHLDRASVVALDYRARQSGARTLFLVPLGVGRSGLVPPGQSVGGDRIAWVFDNSTALITLCTTPAADTGGLTLANLTCSTDKAVLISGYVRFAVGGPPSDVSVTNPAAPMVPVPFGLSLARTAPDPPSTFSCFQEPMNNSAVPYSCAVGITTTDRQWSGSLVFGPPIAIAASVAVASASQYKVCRYHAAASYTLVGAALANQNFVIIKAGDGTTAYTCPTGGTPNTWPHQPAT